MAKFHFYQKKKILRFHNFEADSFSVLLAKVLKNMKTVFIDLHANLEKILLTYTFCSLKIMIKNSGVTGYRSQRLSHAKQALYHLSF